MQSLEAQKFDYLIEQIEQSAAALKAIKLYIRLLFWWIVGVQITITVIVWLYALGG